MSLADLLPGRFGLAGRLPGQIDDLRGPVRGVIMLPKHLSWPGLRECDVSDDRSRRSMYGMLLTQGKRNDIARFVNAALLSQDWHLIRNSLEPRLRRWCERQFALSAVPAAATVTAAGTVTAAVTGTAAAAGDTVAGDSAATAAAGRAQAAGDRSAANMSR